MKTFIAMDTETTGTDPKDHKVIELAMVLYDLDTQAKLGQLVERFNPERSISDAAMRIHGISFSDVEKCKKFGDHAEDIAKFMARADFMVGHNLEFDDNFLKAEFSACKTPFPILPGVCTMKQARWATPDGKSPTLGELCFALRLPYDKSKAHGALYDIETTVACFFKGYRKGFYTLPTEPAVYRQAA